MTEYLVTHVRQEQGHVVEARVHAILGAGGRRTAGATTMDASHLADLASSGDRFYVAITLASGQYDKGHRVVPSVGTDDLVSLDADGRPSAALSGLLEI